MNVVYELKRDSAISRHLFKAPENFNFVNITSTTVGILISEPMEDNVIKRYEASVSGGQPSQFCVIQANSDPLSCVLGGLQPSHEYTVGVKACVHGSDGCGPAIEKSFRTR